MKISVGCMTQDSKVRSIGLWVYRSIGLLAHGLTDLLTHRPAKVFCVFLVAAFGITGCGEESPTEKPETEPITTGISGTTYLNVEHGFRLSNLPASGWIIKTRKYRDVEANTEDVLLMALTTEDKFTFDTTKLVDEQIPFAEVSVYGPNPNLPTKPDVAKEVMNIWIAMWEWMGIEVISRKPVAGSNTTGYEAILSMTLTDAKWTVKWAFFAKHDRGYIISFWAPEDKYPGLVAHIDLIIADFEILGL
jgi:hypothetical protein